MGTSRVRTSLYPHSCIVYCLRRIFKKFVFHAFLQLAHSSQNMSLKLLRVSMSDVRCQMTTVCAAIEFESIDSRSIVRTQDDFLTFCMRKKPRKTIHVRFLWFFCSYVGTWPWQRIIHLAVSALIWYQTTLLVVRWKSAKKRYSMESYSSWLQKNVIRRKFRGD